VTDVDEQLERVREDSFEIVVERLYARRDARELGAAIPTATLDDEMRAGLLERGHDPELVERFIAAAR
jgi:hypothetical protein